MHSLQTFKKHYLHVKSNTYKFLSASVMSNLPKLSACNFGDPEPGRGNSAAHSNPKPSSNKLIILGQDNAASVQCALSACATTVITQDKGLMVVRKAFKSAGL